MTGRKVAVDGSFLDEVRVVTAGEVPLFALDPFTPARYVSHFATCPNADTHRRSR